MTKELVPIEKNELPKRDSIEKSNLNPKKRHHFLLDPLIINRLKQMFRSKTEGVKYAVNAYSYIRGTSLQDIKGRFKMEEFKGLIEANRGKDLDPDLKSNKLILIENLKYHNKNFRLGWRFNFSIDMLIEKINKLTSAQVYFLQEEIWRFWKYESRKVGAIDDFIDFLT